MTKKELLEMLEEYPEDTLIILSADGEGNSYSPLAGYCDGLYKADSTWSGEFISDDDEAYYREEDGWTDADFEDCVPAVVLWPTN